MLKNQILGTFVFLVVSVVSLHIADTNAQPESSDSRHVLFNFDWLFHKGDVRNAQSPDIQDETWREIQLPHDWSIEGPFDKNIKSGRRSGFLPGGIGWYRKHFTLRQELGNKKVSIQFDGVYFQSDVYLNGHHIGFQPYGYVSFAYDLTPYLNYEGDNVLAVRVDHSNSPTSRWYSGSGIYRNVWLIVTDPLHIAHWGTYITTPKITSQSTTVHIQTKVQNERSKSIEATLLTTIKDNSGKVVATEKASHSIQADDEFSFEQSLVIENPALWSPENPVMYTAHVSLSDGSIVDKVDIPFGIREIEFNPQKGFFLNGQQIKMKGMNLHQDGGCLGAAVPIQVWKRRFLKLKELGCNAIRMSHNPPAPEVLDLCDQMGFLVIDEAFDKWRSMYYKQYFDEWWKADLTSMIKRDRNHPSIVLWSVGNEVNEAGEPEGTEILKKLVDFVHELEPSRPVMAAVQPSRNKSMNSSGFADAMDIVGYNYMEQEYENHKARYPERIILGSECYPFFHGREGTHKGFLPTNPWYDVANHEYVVGQFLWAGIDYLGESSGWPSKGWPTGLINTCGFIKANAWFHQIVWNEKPMVRIAVQHDGLDIDPGKPHWSWPKVASHWTFPELQGHVIRIETPTNCETVELLLNDVSMGVRNSADYPNSTILWYLPYAPGHIRAIGRNQDQVVDTFSLQTAGEPVFIQLHADRENILADGQDVVHLEVSLMDSAGVVVPNKDQSILFEVKGNGTLIGVDNGDLRSHESFQGPSRTTYWGRALGIVRATRQPGIIHISVSSPGLKTATVEINTKNN